MNSNEETVDTKTKQMVTFEIRSGADYKGTFNFKGRVTAYHAAKMLEYYSQLPESERATYRPNDRPRDERGLFISRLPETSSNGNGSGNAKEPMS